MSKMQLEVGIVSTFDGKGAAAATAGVRSMSGEIAAANAQANSLVGTVGKLGAGIGVAAAAWRAFDGLKLMISRGIEFNSTLENSRLGMGALISSMTGISDSTGRALQGTEKLNAAMTVAGEIIDDVGVMALKTGAVLEDMLQATGTAMGPALAAKLDIGKGEIQKFVLAVTQMATAVDERLLKNGQLNQEMRGIIEGDTSKNSRLAQIIYRDMRGGDDGVRKTVKDLQEQGKWLAFVMDQMKDYGIAGERYSKTFSGALSNLKDAFDRALGEGTRGQFGQVTQLILDVTKEIVTFDKAGKATFNAQFVSDISSVTETFLNLGKGLIAVTRVADPMARVLIGSVQLVGGVVSSLFETIFGTIEKSLDMASSAMNGFATQIQAHPVLAKLLLPGSSGLAGDLRSVGVELSRQAAVAGAGAEAFAAMKRDYFDAITRAYNGPDPASGLVTRKSNFTFPPPPSGPKEPDKEAMAASKKHAAEILRDRKQELGVLDKITEAMQNSVSTGLLKLNVIRASTDAQKQLAEFVLKTKEIELRERAQIDEVMGFDQLGFIQKMTAAAQIRMAFAQEYWEAEAEFGKQKKDTDAQTLADWFTNAKDTGQKIAEIWAKQAEKELADEKLWQDVLAAARKPFEDFYGSVGGGLKRAMMTALDGGGLRSAFDGFFQSVFDTVGENFAAAVDGWMTKLSNMAAGQRDTGRKNQDGSPIYERFDSGAKGRMARGGVIALQSASALYGMYTNPAPKQSQNMLSGALAGAGIGATFGVGITQVFGAILGGVVGAIAGAFAPTEEGKNIRITGTAGALKITGIDSGTGWASGKLQLEINKAIRSTAAKLDAIFLGLPTAALEAMGNWRPDLWKLNVAGKADGKNWNEELDNYLKETLPGRVFGAYGGSISAALKFAGATDAKLKELETYLRTLKTEEAIQAVSDYVNVLYGFAEIMEMFGLEMGSKGGKRRAVRSSGPADWSPGDEFAANVYKRADSGPLAGYGDIHKRIKALSGESLKGLTHEELVARGQQILTLSQDFFGGIEEYLLKLRDMQRSMTEGIERQKRDISLDQITDPKQRIEFLLAEQRKLYDQLKGASSADEVNRIIARMSENAGSLYDMMGRTPEAAKQIQSMLDSMLDLANERYKLFADDAKSMLDKAFVTVDAILKRLQQGLDETFAGAGGPVPKPEEPPDFEPIERELTSLSVAVAATSAEFNTGLAPSLGVATSNVISFAAALERATAAANSNVNVQLGDIQVDVQVSENSSLIGQVTARATMAATSAAVSKVMRVMETREARKMVTGR